MLDSLATMGVLKTLEIIVAPALLLGALIYGVIWAGRRRKLGAARNAIRDERTEALYERNDTTSHAEALDARNTATRETEDDMTRASLGPRGEPGQKDPARMTPQRAKKTSKHIEPGHTA